MRQSTLTRPNFRLLQEILHNEAVAGLLLVVAAVAAIAWANSPWDGQYFELFHTELSVDAHIFHVELTLEEWVNDALMAVFFFVAGMEIKRELVHGELSNPRRASLPIAAALGGMIVPALIFTSMNLGGDGQKGWGIPMATDIAFAVGVLALAGNRVPFGLKVFLLALAVADDLGAIAVIAVFYTEELSFEAMAIAIGIVVGIIAMQRIGIRSVPAYLVAGGFLWVAVHESGVHATIAGVVLGALTPASSLGNRETFHARASGVLERYDHAVREGNQQDTEAMLSRLEEITRDVESPLDHLERQLHPWTSFVVLPIFALANAGLVITGDSISEAVSSPITSGVFFGLLCGKLAGVFLVTYLMVRLGFSQLPTGVTWTHVTGAALLAGVGFTVSLFVTGLAFDDPALIDDARIGIFSASLIAGIAGYCFLRFLTSPIVDRNNEPAGELAVP